MQRVAGLRGLGFRTWGGGFKALGFKGFGVWGVGVHGCGSTGSYYLGCPRGFTFRKGLNGL